MRSLSAVLLGLVLVLCTLVSSAQARQSRFFVMGSGTMHLLNHRNEREATVHLLKPDGSLNQKGLDTVDWVFGYPTKQMGEHISPRMLFMLSYFAETLAPGKTIHITSAYRSPEYNKKIRAMGNNAARTSTHIDGLALDFWLEGVAGKKIWETVKAKNCAGIGHYGGKIVHFDAGRPRFWQAATSGTRAKRPDENRHLYLSTDFDRYAPGEQVRLSLSSLSNFNFGVAPTVELYRMEESKEPVTSLVLDQAKKASCTMLGTRKATRFLTTHLPEDLAPGRYQLKLSFCDRPFEAMPEEKLSNIIAVGGNH
nr:DUF882 domain-containing protein [uncultured Desulfobulbus sp.]